MHTDVMIFEEVKMTPDDIKLMYNAIRRIEEGFFELEQATNNKDAGIRKSVGTIMADFYATLDFELIPAIIKSNPALDVSQLQKISDDD